MRRPQLLGGLYLGTIMLKGYVNAGRIDRARELFDVLMQTRVEEEPEPPDRGCVVRLTSGSAALFAFFPPFFVRRAVLNLAETA